MSDKRLAEVIAIGVSYTWVLPKTFLFRWRVFVLSSLILLMFIPSQLVGSAVTD